MLNKLVTGGNFLIDASAVAAATCQERDVVMAFENGTLFRIAMASHEDALKVLKALIDAKVGNA